MHRVQLPHVLPAVVHRGETRSDRPGVRGHVGERLLHDARVERDEIERGVADRYAVAALHVVALHLRGLYRNAQAVAEAVDAAILVAEGAAYPGVGGVACAERVAMTPARV